MSGWTAVTVHEPDGLSRDVRDEAREAIESHLSEYTGDTVPTADGYADRTLQVERGADHRQWAERLFDEIPEASRIIVVSTNDTSDSGYGTYFEMQDGDVVEVDSFSGYEGAKGRDVTGYFREEYSLSSYASWKA
jgi:hypothetical protein